MKAWLLRRLIEEGKISPDGISRTLRRRKCTKCGMPVMVGLDDDVAAMTVYLDPWPLSEMGEEVILITSEMTYTVIGGTVKPEAIPRDSFMRRRRPASEGHVVLAAHKCGRELPEKCYAEEPERPTEKEEPDF